MRGPIRKREGRVADVLAALEAAFGKKGWHGPTVLQALAGVTSAQAALKPTGVHHSIHQLVDHVEYWEEAGLRSATTRGKPRRTRRDWSRPTLSFAASVARMKRTHRALVSAISRLTDADLDRSIGSWNSGTLPLAGVLHGVAAHDAYHAGQIRLLRTLIV